jgi:hypothetical protein
MEGVHDLGGRDGFGPVEAEVDEPVFHEAWEGRTFGLAIAAMASGRFNTPMFRHAIERMDPVHYLSSSYYEHWLTAVATLLTESGDVDLDGPRLSRPVSPRAPEVGLEPPATTARFAVGDHVRVRDRRPFGHTRCPAYVRGRHGVVERVEPPANVPEIEAHRRELALEPVYGVRFTGTAVWGEAAEPSTSVHVDLYERYLDRAGG